MPAYVRGGSCGGSAHLASSQSAVSESLGGSDVKYPRRHCGRFKFGNLKMSPHIRSGQWQWPCSSLLDARSCLLTGSSQPEGDTCAGGGCLQVRVRSPGAHAGSYESR